MKKIISLMLALVLCLGLTACGGNGGDGDSQPENTQTETNSPVPEETPSETPAESGEPTAPAEEEPIAEASLSLSRSDFTLFAAGASYRLRYTCQPDIDAIPEYTSSDEAVATVSDDGTVTAVAPGRATITLQYGDLTASCVVRCSWTESAAPSPAPSTQPDPDPVPSQEPEAPAGVDLSDFYTTLTSNYEFPSSLSQASAELMSGYFPGLSDIATEQCLVYINMMSMNMGEIALVQVGV